MRSLRLRLTAQRPRGTAELAQTFHLELAAHEELQVFHQHLHHQLRALVVPIIQKIVVIGDLAASLAAGVEARHPARALAVERKQAKALARLAGGRFTARPDPFLEDGFGLRQQLSSHTNFFITSMPSETFS
jgi:hypothetical protein